MFLLKSDQRKSEKRPFCTACLCNTTEKSGFKTPECSTGESRDSSGAVFLAMSLGTLIGSAPSVFLKLPEFFSKVIPFWLLEDKS